MTINPVDVYNPLVGILGGMEASEWHALSQFEWLCFVVKNSAAAAWFFHEILQAFVSIVVCPGNACFGLFSFCEAYYGMVEAQGQGTLHCHMLLWLHGNPNPQLLHDHMKADVVFSQSMVAWLEHTIKCKLLLVRTRRSCYGSGKC